MKPIKPPNEMSPGAREVPGSSLAAGAFGQPVEIAGDIAPPGLEWKPKGPASVLYYNGAKPPPAGGGAREAMQIKSKPMGGE
jgi:hypothetical protein